MKNLFTIILTFAYFFSSAQTEPINPESVTTETITINEVTFDGTDGTANQSLTTNGSGALSFQSMQPLDADLTAIAAFSSTGFSVRTGTNTWAQRTITGTANEITLTNGNGVSGNPTISIPTALTFTGKTITGGAYTGATYNGVTLTTAGSATNFLNESGNYVDVGGFEVTGTTDNGLITYDNASGEGVVEPTLQYASNLLTITNGSQSARMYSGTFNSGGGGSLTNAFYGSQSTNTKAAIVIQGNTSGSDSGTIPVISIESNFAGSPFSFRPTLAGYNYTTKQWEVGANGTWNYQGNAQSNIGLLDMAGDIDLNTNDIIAGGDIAATTFTGAHNGTVGATTPSTGVFTGITSPTITGGSGTTQSLIYKTTTGVGTTGADHIFQVGNNGATEAMRILNNGNVGIGTSSPNSPLHVLRSSSGSSIVAGNNGNSATIVIDGQDGDVTGGDYAFIRNNHSNTSSERYLSFATNTVERVFISGAGNVGIGTSSPQAPLHVIGNINTTGSRVTHLYTVDQTTTNGEVADSDIRLKKNLAPISSALDKVLLMSGKSWNWDETKRANVDTIKHYGFSAQEMREVLPSVVVTTLDSLGNETLGIRHSEIIPFLAEAIKELKQEIELLKSQK